MKITISIVKGTKDGNHYNVKIGTSIGGGQEHMKDTTLEGLTDKLVEMLEKADEDGYIGKK